MEKLKLKERMNKKGVLGLELSRSVIVTLLVLAVTAIAVFLALVSLQDAGIFTANSQAANDTDLIIGNITTGVVAFFDFTPTWMILLGVAVLIAIIAIVIFAVTRLEGKGTSITA